eukprot:Gb_20493 [translate_table: standard]
MKTRETATMMPKRYSKTYPTIKHNEYFEVGDECQEILLRIKFEAQEWDKVALQQFRMWAYGYWSKNRMEPLEMDPDLTPGTKNLQRSSIFQIAENPYFGEQSKFSRFLVERYHVGQVWINEGVLLRMEKIHLVSGLSVEANREIKSVLRISKKIIDDETRQEFAEGDKMAVNSRGICINRIMDDGRKWASKILSTWFCNTGKPTNLPKGWFRMIRAIAD